MRAVHRNYNLKRSRGNNFESEAERNETKRNETFAWFYGKFKAFLRVDNTWRYSHLFHFQTFVHPSIFVLIPPPPLFLPRYFSRRPLDLGILSRDDLSSSENFIIIIIFISSSSPFSSSSSSSLEISSHRIIYFLLTETFPYLCLYFD